MSCGAHEKLLDTQRHLQSCSKHPSFPSKEQNCASLTPAFLERAGCQHVLVTQESEAVLEERGRRNEATSRPLRWGLQLQQLGQHVQLRRDRDN